MKKIYTLFVALIFAGCLMAQTPQSFKYQAVARDISGNVVTDQAVGMQISILQGSTSGTAVYVETFLPTTNGFGLINLNIGEGTEVSGDFTTINWSGDIYFIKVEMDITGGTAYEEFGTSQLLSVPYALHAKTAANTFSGDYNDLSGAPVNVSTFTNDAGYLTTEVDGDIYNEIQDLSSVLNINNDANNNNITNLAEPVNDQDAATKAYVDALEQQIVLMQNSLITAGSLVRDYDGNIYGVVTIGTQIWMAENLKTTKYNDGTAIPLVTDNTEWLNLTTGAYCWYNNNEATYKNTYGALYIWYTVNTGNLCPTGWHVPTDTEWTTLTDYLGGTSIAGGKLKETGTTHWTTPNTGATNETGFTALPGGNRTGNGTFGQVGIYGFWWSPTEYNASSARTRSLRYSSSSVARDAYSKKTGFSVRCLRD